jgi:type I restriction enzyme S subunit
MESEYPLIELNELVTIHDKRRKPITKSKRKAGIYPYYGASGIADYIDSFEFDGLYVLLAEDGDNLRTKNTPIAFTASSKFWVNNHAHVLQGVDDLDTLYICYALQHADVDSFISGSTRPKITQGDLKQIKIKAPVLHVRRNIAAYIKKFDEKIKLNEQTNQTLEQMAQALFKSWFVDFDPIIDNALAAGNSIPDELQERVELRQRVIAERDTNPKLKPLPDDIQQLFPSEFEESELGWIPKGWEVTSFESLISLIGGGTPKTTIDDYWGGDVPWFSVVDAPNDSDVFVIDTEKHVTQLGVDKSSTKILREGTTIISARGTVGKCALVGSLMAMNQSCYGIVGKFENHDEYIYFLTRYQVSDLQKRGHGSVFNTITRETFKSISLAKSSDLLTQKFSEMVRPYLTKILSNNKQNIELTKLRDVLLPKLISGELII